MAYLPDSEYGYGYVPEMKTGQEKLDKPTGGTTANTSGRGYYQGHEMLHEHRGSESVTKLGSKADAEAYFNEHPNETAMFHGVFDHDKLSLKPVGGYPPRYEILVDGMMEVGFTGNPNLDLESLKQQ